MNRDAVICSEYLPRTDQGQAVDAGMRQLEVNFKRMLIRREIGLSNLEPYKVMPEMYIPGGSQHIVEQVLLAGNSQDTQQYKIVQEILLYLRTVFAQGKIVWYDCREIRNISIKVTIEPEHDRQVYVTIVYAPYSDGIYAELLTSMKTKTGGNKGVSTD